MSHSARIVSLEGERGAVLVLFAVFAPVAILLAAFAIDTGNWFVHKRHLQLQADAGALAAAQAFQPCNNAAIEAQAHQYSGVSGTPLYNSQIGGTPSSRIHELINSQTYYSQPTPVDSSASTAAPCTSQMVDVKLTENQLPWYWRAFSSVPYINAHARVQVFQKTTDTGAEPISVNENAPRAAKAYFVNESNGNVVAQVPLRNQGSNSFGEEIWNNATAPASVPINVTNEVSKQRVGNIGVRIALSGDPNNTTCPSNSQLVNCFDSSSNTTTLVHIQGWSALGTGTPTEPLARSATLSPGTCSDGYFSGASAGCAVGVQARVDVGATPNPAGLTVAAAMGGQSFPLTYNTSGTFSGQWTGSATLAPGSGSNQINLHVKCTGGVTPSCSKTKTTTLEDVQRSYAAGSNSGPIHSAGISEQEGSRIVGGADSFQVCETGHASCTHQLVVNITTTASLANAQTYNDPLYTMRFGSETSTSQTGAIQCPPGGQGGFRESLEKGCSGTYGPNAEGPGWSCPDSATPQDCIETDNGFKTGQLRQGLTERITVPSNGTKYYCPNNWVKNNGEGAPLIPSDDSRIVTVFVTAYGSFGGSGNTWYPIQTFATFYVTGWDGDPCKGDPSVEKDQVVGHFIKYTTLDSSGGGTTKCETNALGQCVAVLTR
jgi:Putative Flp pilus-assembly TadE/G-like